MRVVPPSTSQAWLPPGASVVLEGLQKAELNGRSAIVLGASAQQRESDRVTVLLEGDVGTIRLSVRIAHLRRGLPGNGGNIADAELHEAEAVAVHHPGSAAWLCLAAWRIPLATRPSSRVQRVQRRSVEDLGPAAFRQTYEKTRMPLLLAGAVPSCLLQPQVHDLLRVMLQECGDVDVELVMQGCGRSDDGGGGANATTRCSLGEAVGRLQESSPGNPLSSTSVSALCFSRPLRVLLAGAAPAHFTDAYDTFSSDAGAGAALPLPRPLKHVLQLAGRGARMPAVSSGGRSCWSSWRLLLIGQLACQLRSPAGEKHWDIKQSAGEILYIPPGWRVVASSEDASIALWSEYADGPSIRAAVSLGKAATPGAPVLPLTGHAATHGGNNAVDTCLADAAVSQAIAVAESRCRLESLDQLAEYLRDEATSVEPLNHHVITQTQYAVFAQDVAAALHVARGNPQDLRIEQAHACLRVINLPSAKERQKLISRTIMHPLQSHGVEADFFAGVDGRTLPLDTAAFKGGVQKFPFADEEYTIDCETWAGTALDVNVVEELEARHASIFKYEGPDHRNSVCKNCLNSITPGLVGGHISHSRVWHEALARPELDWVMILEDDAVPDPRLGLDWPAIWDIVSGEVTELRRRGESWDMLYVGRYPSGSPEGRCLNRVLVEPGWCCRTQTYCLSRRGLERLCASGLVHHLFHCPQDEVLGSLIVNDHINPGLARKIQAHCPSGWRALAFRHWGLTLQLMDVESSGRAESQVALAAHAACHDR